MMAQLLALLVGWSELLARYGFYAGTASLGLAVAAVWLTTRVVGARIGLGGRVAPGPVLVVAATVVGALACAWAMVDAVSWALEAPLLGERLLAWAIPEGVEPASVGVALGQADGRLRLPAIVAMSVGLWIAAVVYGVLALALGRTLDELIALEQKPDDVLAREATRRARARKSAGDTAGARDDAEAGTRTPADQPAETGERTPAGDGHGLPDEHALPADRLGRTYRLLGHWRSAATVEPRFLRWQIPLLVTVQVVLGLGILAAVAGTLIVPVWVGAVVVVAALRANRQTPVEAPAVAGAREPGDDEAAAPRPPLRALPALADHVQTLRPPAAPTAAPVTDGDAGLSRTLLAALDIRAPWPHQRAAITAFRAGRSLLLATAPGSGRRTIADALALEALLQNGERVLYLCRDAAQAGATAAAFDVRARATRWRWNILTVDLANRAGALDSASEQPSLVFADPGAVEAELCARWQAWRDLLVELEVIVMLDIEALSGVAAAHTAHVLARLARARQRAHATCTGERLAAGGEALGRIIATASPGHRELGRYARALTGRTMELIATDGAPAGAAAVVVSPDAPLEGRPIDAVVELAARHGYHVHVRSPDGAADGADATLRELDAGNAARCAWQSAHARRETLWLPAASPMARMLAADEQARAALPARILVCWPSAPLIARAQLRATVADDEIALAALRRAFDTDLLDTELAALQAQGALTRQQRTILDGRRVIDVDTASATGERVTRPANCAGPGVRVVERATERLVGFVEASRAPAAAYPGRIIRDGEGRAVRIVATGEQTRQSDGVLLCEATESRDHTQPIRHFDIVVRERRRGERRRGERADERGDRRRAALHDFGGRGLIVQHRDVDVVEHAVGVRRFDRAGALVETALHEAEIVCRYRSRAAILGLPAGEHGEVSGAALHALVNLCEDALPAIIRAGEDDLEVTSGRFAIDGEEVACVALLDLHPGGAGFADALDSAAVRALLGLADALARSRFCPERAWCSHAVPEAYEQIDLERAREILASLLPR